MTVNGTGRVLERINLRDEVARVRQGRQQVQEKMRRLAKAYMDNLVDEDDYQHQKLRFEMELESLVVPEADSVAEAGRLVERLPELWAAAAVVERRRLLLTVLDAVYVDVREERVGVSIKPKAASGLFSKCRKCPLCRSLADGASFFLANLLPKGSPPNDLDSLVADSSERPCKKGNPLIPLDRSDRARTGRERWMQEEGHGLAWQ